MGTSKTGTVAPIIQQHELTCKCNDNCTMCYNPERCIDEYTPREEDADRNIEIANISVKKGVMAVCLTGGEPLLMGRNFFKVLKIYAEAGCYTSMNSNGRLVTPAIAAELKSIGLNSALISIHGVGEVNDSVVNVKGAYKQRLNGIRLLHAQGIAVTPNFVASSINVDGLFDLGAVLYAEGIRSMTVTPFLPSYGAPNHESLVLSAEQYREMFDTILKLRKLGIKIDSTLPIPPCVLIKFCPTDWQDYLEVHSPRICMAGKSFGVIGPEGYFRSCIQAPNIPEFGGNMLEEYDASWANANTWADAKLLPQKCIDCPGLSICGGGCRTSSLWVNNGSACGDTMYIGDALTDAQADIFRKRISDEAMGSYKELNSVYEIKEGIKLRQESFGTIIFNPQYQSFTIVNQLNPTEIFKVTDITTLSILNAIGAIKRSDKPSMKEVSTLPGNVLLPRMAQNFKDAETYYCLRADTGERYYC